MNGSIQVDVSGTWARVRCPNLVPLRRAPIHAATLALTPRTNADGYALALIPVGFPALFGYAARFSESPVPSWPNSSADDAMVVLSRTHAEVVRVGALGLSGSAILALLGGLAGCGVARPLARSRLSLTTLMWSICAVSLGLATRFVGSVPLIQADVMSLLALLLLTLLTGLDVHEKRGRRGSRNLAQTVLHLAVLFASFAAAQLAEAQWFAASGAAGLTSSGRHHAAAVAKHAIDAREWVAAADLAIAAAIPLLAAARSRARFTWIHASSELLFALSLFTTTALLDQRWHRATDLFSPVLRMHLPRTEAARDPLERRPVLLLSRSGELRWDASRGAQDRFQSSSRHSRT